MPNFRSYAEYPPEQRAALDAQLRKQVALRGLFAQLIPRVPERAYRQERNLNTDGEGMEWVIRRSHPFFVDYNGELLEVSVADEVRRTIRRPDRRQRGLATILSRLTIHTASQASQEYVIPELVVEEFPDDSDKNKWGFVTPANIVAMVEMDLADENVDYPTALLTTALAALPPQAIGPNAS